MTPRLILRRRRDIGDVRPAIRTIAIFIALESRA